MQIAAGRLACEPKNKRRHCPVAFSTKSTDTTNVFLSKWRIAPPAIAPVRVVGGGEAATVTGAAIIMGKTADGLAREGPPPQRPPSKTQFDFHTRHLLHTLSQHLPNADPATTEYSTLSEEDARLVRRTVGRAQRALERRQERKKKSKSTGTAADALDFYRHATVRARKMKGLDPDEEEDLEEHELLMSDSDSDDEEEDSSDDDADDDEEEEESSSSEEEESEEEVSDEEDDKDDDKKADAKGSGDDGSDGSGEDDESAASFTSDEFLSAHNDLCEVCSGVGDDDAPLLCCATCTLVFHQDCHRPVLVKEPPDTWSCAYCDDSGVTLHKRDSRERKRASKGVRDMKKMTEDQAELERTEAVAARAAEAAAAGGGTSSPSKSRGGTGSSTRTPPQPAHNIRDPDTGRFMTTEKRIALYGSATGMPPGEGEELEGEGEGGTTDGSGEDDESAASFTSDEFLSAHNDLCEVCSGVGDDDAPLLCCATCTLVFHQDCHRPVLVKEPPDTWSCAYCDDSGVTLHKRDSRERKRASKGVRDMKKMTEDQAELERTEAVAARAAEAAAAGGGTSSPSKSRGGTGSSTRTPPQPAHNIRDPDTGRFMTTEKRIALYGSATGMPPGEGEEVEGEGEGGTKQNDLSDLTAEEIARLASSGGDDNGDEKPPAAVSSGAESKPRADTKQDAASGATTPTGPGGSPQNKQQLKGAELKLLLGAMSPEEVDISGPRARREQRKAPSLYDPGDMGGDMDWSSKKEAETRSGRRAAAPPGSKKRKRELLSDVLGKNKKGKSSGGGEKNPKRRRKEEKKKAKRAAIRKKKKVSVQIIVALCYVSAF